MKKLFLLTTFTILTSLSTGIFAGDGHSHGEEVFGSIETSDTFTLVPSQIRNLNLKTTKAKYEKFYHGVSLPIIVRERDFSNSNLVIYGFMMPTKESREIKKGQKVLITLDSVQKQITGTVGQVDKLDPKTRTYPIWIKTNNPLADELNALQGKAFVLTSPIENALGVPTPAVLGEFGHYFVYIKEGLNFEKRPVVIGHKMGNLIEILNGIHENEEVVTLGNYQLQYVSVVDNHDEDEHDHEKEEEGHKETKHDEHNHDEDEDDHNHDEDKKI